MPLETSEFACKSYSPDAHRLSAASSSITSTSYDAQWLPPAIASQ